MALKSKSLDEVRPTLPTLRAADVNPDEKLARINLNLPESLRWRFKTACNANKRQMTEVLLEFMAQYADDYDTKNRG